MELRKPVFRIYAEGLAVKPPALHSDPADGGPAGRLRPTLRLPPLQPGARVESSFCLCRLGSWVLLRLPQEMGPAPKKLLKCGIHTLHQHFPCLIPFLGTKFRFPFIVLCLFIHSCMHEFIHSLFMFIHSFSE